MANTVTTTLIFLKKEDKVLLALKKRGFGEGKWNGVGGKLEENETEKEAAIRETKEEINVTISDIEQSAMLHFIYPKKGITYYPVSVYVAHSWTDEPQETEEMRPKWYSIDQLPLKEMWDDDQYWLQRVLGGEKIIGCFVFDTKNIVQSHTITPIKSFTNH